MTTSLKTRQKKGVDRLNYDFKVNIRNWINRNSLVDNTWAKLYSKKSHNISLNTI